MPIPLRFILMDDIQFRQLIERFGFSWAGYRKVRKGVKKRITRHMRDLGCRNMDSYLLELENSPEKRCQCKLLMTVSISRFLRDRELWLNLQHIILPNLIKKKTEKLRIWSAGCASGEEAYSFNIIWENMGKSVQSLPKPEITATDMNPEYLDRSQAGVYQASSLREVRKEFRSAYFETKKSGKYYAVKPALKENIVWKQHNMLWDDPPGSGFHIIFLRNNLLTYYDDKLKTEAFRKITDSLSPYGFMIIGSHENLPAETDDLVTFASCSCVFRKFQITTF